jgi:hypothetical protein
VLCVTHLPQVASQGHHHLRVAKSNDGRTTRTALTHLTAVDRVEEIARMLGGVEVTGKAREHAKEMLRTHLELPPDPTPTDRMPALKQKDVLAQAKTAAKESKDPGSEPKSLGVDPRATAVLSKDTAVAAKGTDGGKGSSAAKGGEGKAPSPAKGAAKAPSGDTGDAKPANKPAAGKADGNVIDLNAAKAAGRPASSKRR